MVLVDFMSNEKFMYKFLRIGNCEDAMHYSVALSLSVSGADIVMKIFSNT